MIKKIKIWLFKKIFIKEANEIAKELQEKNNQIENLKKRCHELNKGNIYLLHQNACLQEKLNINHMI